MRTSIEVPDELYRLVKAKSALEGSSVRDVAIRLFRSYVDPVRATEQTRLEAEATSPLLADGKAAPPWYGLARKYIRRVEDHSMDAVRESIARGWASDVEEREQCLRRPPER